MIRKLGPGRYEVAVYLGRGDDGKRRQKSRTVGSEREAKRLERKLLTERDDGRRLDGEDAPLDRLLDEWLEAARMEESTRYQARVTLARHVRPRLGKVPICELRPEHFDRLYTEIRAGSPGRKAVSRTTAHRIHGYLRLALGLAVRREWIAANPVLRAEAPGEEATEPDPPPIETVRALLEHAARLDDEGVAVDGDLRDFVWVAASTGMRRSAICAVRRSDLDLTAGLLRVRRSLGIVGGKVYEKPPKSKKARHPISLGPGTVAVFQARIGAQDGLARAWGLKLAADPFLFAADPECSLPLHPHVVSRRFADLRQAVPGAETVQLRDLRHFMVTWGLESGVSLRAVSGRVGHARPSTTMDRYAAFVGSSDEGLAASIESALAPPAPVGE